MIIEKQISRIIITDYSANDKRTLRLGINGLFNDGYMSAELFNEAPNDKNKLRKVLSEEDFTFFYENDNKIYFPIGVFKDVKKLFPLAKVRESGAWDSNNMKWAPRTLPSPRNNMQEDSIRFLYSNSSNVILTAFAGAGKAEPYSREIPTPNGIKCMGSLKIGDEVFDRHGQPTNIIGIYEQGVRDIYRVTFNDGRYALCDIEHLWNVKTNPDQDIYDTKSLSEMIDDYKIINNNEISYKYHIPVNETVVYNNKYITMDPWALGYNIKNLNEIPNEYIYNSEEIRIRLLLGIMEMIGSIYSYKDIKYGIYTSDSLKILQQIQYILWGLGIKCIIEYDQRLIFNIPNKYKSEFDHIPANEIPMDIFNKKIPSDNYLTITKIEYVRKEQARCIRVDNPESLYLTENFIVTHNTFMASFVSFKLQKRTLIVVPTTNLKKQWRESLVGLFKVPNDRIIDVEKKEDLLEDKDWFIVLQQTIMSMNKEYKLEDYFKQSRIGTKIIDEAHLFLRNTLMIECITNFENSIRLTATFGRSSDHEDRLIKKAFASTAIFDREKKSWYGTYKYPQKKHVNLYSINLNSGIPKSELSAMTTFKYGLNVMKYANLLFPDNNTKTKFESQIIEILKQVIDNITYGKMIFLFPTIIASEKMAKYIQKLYPDKIVRSLNSSHSKKENQETIKSADIIVSTSKSSGTGLDIKGLSVVVTAEQYKSPILSEQIFGRLRERSDGKDTFFYDITDLASKQLVSWRNNRMDIMRRRAKSFKLVKGTNLKLKKVLTEDYEYLQEMYTCYLEYSDYENAMKTLEELYYYI